MSQKGYLIIAESAKYLGISRSTLVRLIKSGAIEVRQHSPRRKVISVAELERYSASTVQAPEPDSLSKFQRAKLRVIGSLKTEDTAVGPRKGVG